MLTPNITRTTTPTALNQATKTAVHKRISDAIKVDSHKPNRSFLKTIQKAVTAGIPSQTRQVGVVESAISDAAPWKHSSVTVIYTHTPTEAAKTTKHHLAC